MTSEEWIAELRSNAKIMMDEHKRSGIYDNDKIEEAGYFDSIADHIETIEAEKSKLLAALKDIVGDGEPMEYGDVWRIANAAIAEARRDLAAAEAEGE